jgi:hypothetical protein
VEWAALGPTPIIAAVPALARFEGWLHDVLEVALPSALGGHVQPVDLANRLADHMVDRRLFGAGRVYAPNNYRLYLAPRALVGFAAFQEALEEELGAFLAERGSERGLHFVGRVRVSLLADAALRRDQVRIESDVIDRAAQGHVEGRTEAIAMPISAPAEAVLPVALVVGSRRFPLPPARTVTIGRALDNDVILEDSSVSRHHARLTLRGRYWLLEDLDSSHGLYVNGRRVPASLLRPGDQMRIGGVLAQLARLDAATPS